MSRRSQRNSWSRRYGRALGVIELCIRGRAMLGWVMRQDSWTVARMYA